MYTAIMMAKSVIRCLHSNVRFVCTCT